jgi:DNA-binding transcriptional LysR family regulator
MSFEPVPDIGARQLLAVLAVAENRSFVAAAAELHMSQPALTRMIKRVEDVLGVDLFERTTRSVRLTDAGVEFVGLARRVTDDLRIAARAMRERADQQRGQVIVSTLISVAHGVLPDAISAYRRARPGVEIHVRDGVHDSVLENVRSGAADFGITYMKDIATGLHTSPLGRGQFELVASPELALPTQSDGLIRFDDLMGVPLVSMPPGSQTRRLLDATAAARGFTLDHAAVVSQIPTLVGFVRAGVGAGLVPSALIGKEQQDGLVRLSVCDPRISLDIGVLRMPGRSLSPAAAGLLEVIEAAWCQTNA